MIGFWLLAAALLLVGYAFFVPALFGKTHQNRMDRQRLNLLLHKQRGEELAREAGGDDPESLAAELDKDLLSDLTVSAEHAGTDSDRGRWPLIAALLLTPILTAMIYGQLGRVDLVSYQAESNARSDSVTREDLQARIEQLAERLQRQPDDLEGWVLLARSLSATRQFDQAVQAYGYALKLAPDNLDIKALYAQSMAETQEGNLAGQPAEMIAAILQKNPLHPSALWLGGLAAAQKGDSSQAAALWKKLKSQLPDDSDAAQQLSKYIAELQGQSATTGAAASEPKTARAKSIRVRVTLADAVEKKAAPDDTVFIFARAASGPPMPLAIVRKQVKDLPVEVTLDDSMSMMQGMSLSSFDKVVIGARVSKTGTATPSTGDLQGLTDPTAAENGQTYSVQIAQEVR